MIVNITELVFDLWYAARSAKITRDFVVTLITYTFAQDDASELEKAVHSFGGLNC